MNPNEQLIEEFFAGMADKDVRTMSSCYHPEVVFSDPIFGTLIGQNAIDMWEMLLSSATDFDIQFSNIRADADSGSATWIARYSYGRGKRPVENHVQSDFAFRDGLIVRHTDVFDLARWNKQALGFTGKWFGKSALVRNSVRKNAAQSLLRWQSKRNV